MSVSPLSCQPRLSSLHNQSNNGEGGSNRWGGSAAARQNLRRLLRYPVRGPPQFPRNAPPFLGLYGYEFFSVGVTFLPRFWLPVLLAKLCGMGDRKKTTKKCNFCFFAKKSPAVRQGLFNLIRYACLRAVRCRLSGFFAILIIFARLSPLPLFGRLLDASFPPFGLSVSFPIIAACALVMSLTFLASGWL